MLAGTNGLFSLLFAVEAVKMLTRNMKLKNVSDSANGSYAILLTAFLEEDLWTNSFTQECEVNHAGC